MNTAKQPNFYEQVSAAVDSGDRQQISNLYRDNIARYGSFGANRANLSEEILEASANAAKKNPRKFQQDMLAEILAMQSMLLHRVSEHIRTAIARHDKEDRGFHPWGNLPEDVTGELLPRFARISAEVMGTVKMLRKLESPPAKFSPVKPEPAKDDDKDASA